jgi:hypothetical protein
VLLLLIGAGAFFFLFPGDAEAAEVFLVPAASTGPDPFSENPFAAPPDPAIAKPAVENSPPVNAAPPPGPVQATSGATPGLYGGTRNRASCDPDQMVSFLAANPDKAQAWVNALTADPQVRLRDGSALTTATIPDYVAELTSLVLMADTRVTNHGFKNGRSTRLQSVLQKGSAVLVDEYGVPRVKCYCGNPLLPPTPPRGTARYEGPRWPDFDPNRITVVGRPPTPIDTFIVRIPPDGDLVEVPRGGVPGRAVPPDVFEDGEGDGPPPEAYVSSDPPQVYPPSAEEPAPPPVRSPECSPPGSPETATEILITNDMRETATIVWVDESCDRQITLRIPPGGSSPLSTYVGHTFVALVEGTDHAQFRVSRSSSSWVIQ